MKKALLTILLTLATAVTAFAADDSRKSVFNVITYGADGRILHNGYGFYVGADGTALAPYSLFENAVRADVIDTKGNKATVLRILGASSTADMVKFRTSARNPEPLEAVTQPSAEGEAVSVVYYMTGKKEQPLAGTVSAASPYNAYVYYGLSVPNEEKYMGCPVVNEAGHVVAVVQKNVEKDAATACAMDVRMGVQLRISGMSFANSDLQAIHIPKALPDDEAAALTYLYMMNQSDSLLVQTAYDDFLKAYPANADGYVARANFYAAHGRMDLCDKDYQQAFKCAAAADEVHYALSKTIFTYAATQPEPVYRDWTLERAAAEAAEAFRLKENALYAQQRGHCLFAGKKYAEAAAEYETVCRLFDGMEEGAKATPENYFYAARALELAGGDSLRVLALMDSAVARCPRPYTAASAQYLLERAQRRIRAGQYRPAVFDFNEYEKAVGASRLSARFYHLREQAEMEARMYQQALDDIRTAIVLAPAEVFYRIEEASVLLQVGLTEDAIAAAEAVLKDLPENPDCYKIIGVGHGMLGDRAKAAEALAKAVSLGDESAEELLRKYAQ